MPVHLVAYEDAVGTAGTLAALVPVPDSTVTINGNHVLVPDKYNQMLGAACLDTASAVTQAQLQSPSLREMFFPDVEPLIGGATFAGTFRDILFPNSPLQLVTNEGLDFYQDGGGASSYQYGLVWLCDAPPQPVKGTIFTMRATASITQAVGAWTNGALTFNQTLPVGNYSIVGMKAVGTGLVAARLVFIGASAVTRMGCPGVATMRTQGPEEFRMGNMGVFGTFNSTTPPTVDVIGGTASSQTFEFDLMPAAA